MKVSHNWLQRFFDDELPAPEVVAEKLTFGVFEIEGVEQKDGDTIFDVKVLPDRACYALSHRGIAREVATLCNLSMKDPLRESTPTLDKETEALTVVVEEAARAPYYAVALIRGIKAGPSPSWLKTFLESVGQKSINNIVDATNFVMFDLGTPLHAFDAEKLSGQIVVRAAKAEEKMTLLGGMEKELTHEMTLITDDGKTPIAIAGVKGGAHAELSNTTTDILIEAASFDAVRTRKTASTLNLKTDASKRFENGMAVELPAHGMQAVVKLILEIAGGELAGYAMTALPYKIPYKLGISTDAVNRLLGTTLSERDVSTIFDKLGFSYEIVKDPIAQALEIAKAQMGKPYKLGASITREAPHAFDCSSLVAYAYAQAGVAIPRVSIDQYVWGEPVDRESLAPGDLVFFNTKKEGVKIWYETVDVTPGRSIPEGVSHVGMYCGEGLLLHARKTSGAVIQEPLADVEARVDCVGYRRIVTDSAPRFVVTTPPERLDLRLPQDLIEEIARVHGYDAIETQVLSPAATASEANPQWCAAEQVRKALSDLGFVEVYTHTLRSDGEVKLANALAPEKSTLRSSLAAGIAEALTKNEYNAPLLATDTVKIFEIGNVFTKAGEETHVCIGVRPLALKKRSERANAQLLEAKAALETVFGPIDHHIYDETLEFDLSSVTARMREIVCPSLPLIRTDVSYQPLSVYPFVLRDIALWVSEGTAAEEVRSIISAKGGSLLVRLDQFDTFTKESKTSYAFHLVFQSLDKTLSDPEVHAIMADIQSALDVRGWEIR